MALTTGTFVTSSIVQAANQTGDLQYARIVFTMSGTYDQALNSSLVGVPTLIKNARHSNKTYTLRGATLGNPATKASDPRVIMAVKTVAVSGADVTFELTDGDYTTELAAAAIPEQKTPFSILVAFTE
jgi:hypothetical protein